MSPTDPLANVAAQAASQPWHVAPDTLLAILAMAVATYATRITGMALLGRVRPGPRLQAALDAVPVAILTAVIAPSVVAGGAPDMLAALVTAVAAFRLPLLATFLVGIASAVVFRALLG